MYPFWSSLAIATRLLKGFHLTRPTEPGDIRCYVTFRFPPTSELTTCVPRVREVKCRAEVNTSAPNPVCHLSTLFVCGNSVVWHQRSPWGASLILLENYWNDQNLV